MSSFILIFDPSRLDGIKCAVAARISPLEVTLRPEPGSAFHAILTSSSDVRLSDPKSICLLLAGSSSDLRSRCLEQQWAEFALSELRPFRTAKDIEARESREFLERVLNSLESTLGDGRRHLTANDDLSVCDLLVAVDLAPVMLSKIVAGSSRKQWERVRWWHESVLARKDLFGDLDVLEVARKTMAGAASKDAKETKGRQSKNERKAKENKNQSRSQNKLRILCLHGYRQSSSAFRAKTGSFRKAVASAAELVYMDAPHVIPNREGDAESTEGEERGWWFSRSERSFDAHEFSDCDDGFEEGARAVTEAWRKEGPFDGVMAFSQGAALLVILCLRRLELGLDFKFAVFVAPFRSRSRCHDRWFEGAPDGAVDIPTLHVIGDTDKVIEREMSDKILRYFHSPTILRHGGGHFVPATSKEKSVYIEFLKQQQDGCSK